MNLFVCDRCRTSRDSVCPTCANFERGLQGAAGPKLEEATAALGKYIDKFAHDRGLL